MATTAPDASEPAKPKPIIRLSEDVVNQIAAAEVSPKLSAIKDKVIAHV